MRAVCLAACLTLILAACGGATPAPVPTATALPPTITPPPLVTQAPLPTRPPLPTATAVPPAILPTAPLPSATPDFRLAQAKLAGIAWLKEYTLLLSFDFPAPVDPGECRVMMEEKPFTCERLVQVPNRLYCTGRGAKVLDYAWVRIYPQGSAVPGYEQKVWVPFFDNVYSPPLEPKY